MGQMLRSRDSPRPLFCAASPFARFIQQGRSFPVGSSEHLKRFLHLKNWNCFGCNERRNTGTKSS